MAKTKTRTHYTHTQLGRANGLGQTVAAVVRGIGPALGGTIWSWTTIQTFNGHVYTPFILMILIGPMLIIIASLFLNKNIELKWEQAYMKQKKQIKFNYNTQTDNKPNFKKNKHKNKNKYAKFGKLNQKNQKNERIAGISYDDDEVSSVIGLTSTHNKIIKNNNFSAMKCNPSDELFHSADEAI